MVKKKEKLSLALISTDYPPLCTSASVQMYDLAKEMVKQGHEITMIVPTSNLQSNWLVETVEDVNILRLAAPSIKDVGYFRRTLSELSLPLLMIYRILLGPYAYKNWDIVVWYSPTIFFGPLIWFLKKRNSCRTYLILRDIFPEWALDLGLIKKGIIYSFYKYFANLQYSVADIIGVQTPSNLTYLSSWIEKHGKTVEVLNNWQTPLPNIGTGIDISLTEISGRKIFIYIGNMGVAQNIDILIDLAEILKYRNDIGFVFIGRGSEVQRLKKRVNTNDIKNTLFFSEIDFREIPGLLSQCYLGLISLDHRHKSHNIPGKFLTYMNQGLPVLARVNPDTDLQKIVNQENVGKAFHTKREEPIVEFIENLISSLENYKMMSSRCRLLAKKMFSTKTAVKQILNKSNNIYNLNL